MRENKQKYFEYISSWKWTLIREKALIHYGRSCMRCKNEQSLHVHHMTYKTLFKEEMTDLAILCFRCHRLYHKIHKRTSIETTKEFIENTNLVYVPKSKSKKKGRSFKEGVLLGYRKCLIKENRRLKSRKGGLLDEF